MARDSLGNLTRQGEPEFLGPGDTTDALYRYDPADQPNAIPNEFKFTGGRF